jgi:amino acid transporter
MGRRSVAAADVLSMSGPRLRKALGFRDLLLFYVATTFSLRWMATAAASGPAALVIWLGAAAGLFVPLVFTTIELSSRYPQEGGIYIWARNAFGPFAGFITGWLYWCTNLPYFPSLLYFAAGNLVFAAGDAGPALSSNRLFFIVISLAGLGLAVYMNVVGLQVGKWLNNVGAIASWAVAAALIVFGTVAWLRFGSATPFPAASFVPSVSVKDMIFWSTIAFAFVGVESGSAMAEEIDDARRTLPRAVIAAAVSIVLLYLAGTFSILVAVPHEQVSGLQGIMQALQAVATRIDAAWLLPALAVAIAVSSIGGVGGWFAAVARLPFVAGIDRFLPPAFGRVHHAWRTPHVALLTQAGVSALFVVLGQAGTSVRGAYDVLVSMSVITNFIPFLFMFAALIRVQREPAAPGVIRIPGGSPVATGLGALGFLTTTVAIVLACVPAADDPNPTLAVVKVIGLSVVMILTGVGVYAAGRKGAPPLRR